MAQIKPYDTFSDVKEHVKRGRVLSKGSTLTIDTTGTITVTDSYHLVATNDPENSTTDDLKIINSAVPAQAGQILVLQASDTDETVVVKDYASGSDNIRIGADVSLDQAQDTVTLMWNGSAWNMLASSTAATPS